MSRNLSLFEDSRVPQELLDYRSAMDGELKRNPYEVSLAIEKFEKAAINAVNLPRQNVKTESVSEEDYTKAGFLFPSANPLLRAEVKRLQAVFNTLLNGLGSLCLPNGNAALSLDQLPDYTNYIMRLHASTDIIFEEVRRQALARSQTKFKALTKVKNIYQEMLKAVADCVTEELTQSENLITQISRAAEEKKRTLKEEVFANELENDHLVHMHSLYHAREERVNAETQASTRKLQKCATKLLFMAGRLSSENCVTSVKKVLNTRLVWSFRWKDLQSLGHSLTSLHLAKLTIDTESIFAILELIHVQMEKIGNYILNSVAVLRNLQRTQVR
ncbi:unnamed protein product [Dibothriocephalus latus]|uniref:Uncharacterized protein n=1 Tax=Dibothriocephalus latus TaxID=60516 RepID=A0A3P7M7H3_DIBLA|nr:unnamed protein product [Dibothriocephalus latus]